ncbi:amino acid permease-domain-containing protein [Cokeromyces recurvatus]|uniref:amino acid permease-domain-containing protein n=1 Tax=Cokeromyces recurvatus TaxID=90255 RepID=UPI002220B204|nr:amino acid permease-domain-containing protein [Cokeromyces recurvatus]KAI7901031.1 amino acid permease-domain-containing protein [Cokeromyces recurvatus]
MTWGPIKLPDRAFIYRKATKIHEERKKGREEIMMNDELLLAKLGYKQSLNRQLSTFSNFAISFGCCSVLSGLLPLWGTTILTGGTSASIWGYLIVALLTLTIGSSLAEICSAFPTTGGLYFWTAQLSNSDWVPFMCWIVGYFNWLSLSVAICAGDLGMAGFLASAISVMHPNFVTTPAIDYGIFIAILVIHGWMNTWPVKYTGIINNISVWWHIMGISFIVIVGLVLTPNKPSVAFALGQSYNGSGFSSNGYAWLIGLLQAQFTLNGYDTAAHVSEETRSAQRSSPIGIVMAIGISAIAGTILMIACAFMIQDFDTQIVNSHFSMAITQVFIDGLGVAWTMWFLVIILVAMYFAGAAVIVGSSRQTYAFARDGAMPFSKWLSKLTTTKVPANAVWFNIIFAAILGIPYLFSEVAFETIVSINTISANLSYFVPIWLRITMARNRFQKGPFHLGKWSIPCGVIASAWILFTSVLFMLPTQWPVTVSNMNFAIIPFVVVIGLASFVYLISGRKWFTGPVRDIDTITIRKEDGQIIHETRRVILLSEDDDSSQHDVTLNKTKKGNEQIIQE